MKLLAILAMLFATADSARDTGELRWYKGNTHTHTLESDGDSSPEEVVRWYSDHGYDFLVITDHDRITKIGATSMVMISGEEITDRLGRKPLHVNALGIETAIQPQGGATVVEVLQRNVDAVRAAGGLALVNHPNFGWAFAAEELLKIKGPMLLEIASGHPFVNMDGPPSVETMWDELLTAGRRVWGVAVDDSHHLRRPWDIDIAPPGKAWIVVRAPRRDAKSILTAIERGDFYSSTGVELNDYVVSATTMTVSIREKNRARYTTQFIGPAGRVLHETRANPAVFTLPRKTAYIRARVVDSNGRRAWLQPYFAETR